MPDLPYTPAWWLPGAHLRTLWGKVARRGPVVETRIERWATPDADFIDVHRLEAESGRPRLVLLHGLEGSPASHYARGLLAQARARGWAAAALVFRSCGPELNRTRRFYHSGETGDLDLVVRQLLAEDAASPIALAGYSLGGNVLLKWLGERGADVPPAIRAAAAISVPFDLERASRYIHRGLSRVYERHFLRSLRRKALRKRARFPDLAPLGAIRSVRTMIDFDDIVTGPAHGFAGALDYYARSSSLGWLARIRVPTLLLSAADDPFIPREVLADVRAVARDNPALEVEFPERGGHVGFIGGRVPWRPVYYAEERVAEFLSAHIAGEEISAGGFA